MSQAKTILPNSDSARPRKLATCASARGQVLQYSNDSSVEQARVGE